jgi:hypothetical protein
MPYTPRSERVICTMRAASRRPQHRPSSKELVLQGWGHAEGVGTSSRHKQQANGISPFRLKNEAKPLNLQASWANTCGSWAFSRSRKWRRKFGGEPTGAGEGIRTLDPNLGKVMLLCASIDFVGKSRVESAMSHSLFTGFRVN